MGKRDFEDDGRTIADMSGLERPSPMFLPRFRKPELPKGAELPAENPDAAPKDTQNWDASFTPKQRRIAIWAALSASMLVALAYIVGLGLVILLLLWLWS